VAIRVTFVSLPGSFNRWDGLRLWAAEPELVSEAAAVASLSDAPTSPALAVARLGCTPYCRSDWHTFGTLHLLHEGIVPQGLYRIQAVHCHHDLGQEPAYSAGLELTMPAGGDCCGPPAGKEWPGPDGRVDLGVDVAAVLAKFANQPGSPSKARVDIAPVTPDYRVDVVDVTWFIDAFRGLVGPEAPAAGTPCG
jgi:hypothetical protein